MDVNPSSFGVGSEYKRNTYIGVHNIFRRPTLAYSETQGMEAKCCHEPESKLLIYLLIRLLIRTLYGLHIHIH